MRLLIYGVVALAGLAIGSFLNVCIHRLPEGESIAFPPSHCPNCGHQIGHLDNIPIFSYLILKGRCRDCGSKISLRYPVVEALTGALFIALYWRFDLSATFVFSLVFTGVLIATAFIDIDHQIIPDRLVLPAMAASLIFLLLDITGYGTMPLVGAVSAVSSLVGLLAGGGTLLVIAFAAPVFLKKEAMGGGDIKLAAFMGLYLGGYVMLALLTGFFLGAIAGIVFLATGKRSRSDMISFGPFLALGGLIALFFGPQIWASYTTVAGL